MKYFFKSVVYTVSTLLLFHWYTCFFHWLVMYEYDRDYFLKL